MVETIVEVIAILFCLLWFYERFFAPISYTGRWVFMYDQGDVLYLQSLSVRRNSGDLTVVPKDDVILEVSGNVKVLSVEDWPSTVPIDALCAVKLLDEGTASLSVYSTKFPNLSPFVTEIVIADPVVEYVSSGWIKAE